MIFVYVDDIFIVGSADAAQSAGDIFKIARATVGFKLEPAHGKNPTARLRLLGADVSVGWSFLTSQLQGRKSKDLSGELRQISDKGALTTARAAKIRGRLFFAIVLARPCRPVPAFPFRDAELF